MSVLFAGIGANLTILGAGLAVLFGLLLLAYWWGGRKERQKAKVADARLRAGAAKAGLEGYIAEKTRLDNVDPVSGRSLDELRGPPGAGSS